MPDRPSAIARLRPSRRRTVPRRETRRYVSRPEARLIVLSTAAQTSRAGRGVSAVWTLYARWLWTVGTARAERARRRARPSWH